MSIAERKMKKLFIDGPITPEFIAESIAKHSSKKNIGAHQIFLGQIRSDEINGQTVHAIEFSAYDEMAKEVYNEIREEIFEKYELTCMHVYHSLGKVMAGEINMFIFVSSVHRRQAIDACTELIELMKTKIPIWGKEIFSENNFRWKVNN
jgi:molybdopterin synthase catalytic subunit